jgi:biotin-(acetyl-CoA carboxylase) ligase
MLCLPSKCFAFTNALPNLTSLKILFTNTDWNILDIIKTIFEHVSLEMQKLTPPKFAIKKERYTNILYQYGIIQRFEYENIVANGMIKDVLQNGQLLVQFEDGETKAFNQKEIVFL